MYIFKDVPPPPPPPPIWLLRWLICAGPKRNFPFPHFILRLLKFGHWTSRSGRNWWNQCFHSTGTAFLSTNHIYALLSHFSLPKIGGAGIKSQSWQCCDFESIGYISFSLTWVWWKQWNGGRRSWGQAWGQSSPSSEGLPCEPKTACHPYMPRRHQKGIFLSDLYLQLT